MAIRSGLAAQIGAKAETTWGTRAVPDHFWEASTYNVDDDTDYMEAQGMRASNYVQRSDRVVQNKKGVKLDAEIEVLTKGHGLLLKHTFGASAITTPGGATNTRDHTYTITDPWGLGLTFQAAFPDTGGTVDPFELTGCKVVSSEFSNALDGFLIHKISVDGKAEDVTQSLAAASYNASMRNLHFQQGAITLNSITPAIVKDISIKVEISSNTDRRGVGVTTKLQPILNGLVKISGDMTVEWEGLTHYNLFKNNTVGALSAIWTDTTAIEGSFFPKLDISIPACQVRKARPQIQGHDIVTQKLSFVGLYDGSSEPITVVYRTTDVTD